MLVIGDSHGSWPMLRAAIELAAELDARQLVSVGDFGIWPGKSGAHFLDLVDARAERHGVRVSVVPGNHDDYDQLDRGLLENDGWWTLRPNVRAAERGTIWQAGGVKFQAFGGAASIDGPGGPVWWPGPRRTRDGGVWWERETITQQDVDRAVAAAEAHGPVDVLICHDAPARVPLFGVDPLEWAHGHDQRLQIQRVVDQVRPLQVIAGHHHQHVRHAGASWVATVLSADVNPDAAQWALVRPTGDGKPRVTVPEPWGRNLALTDLVQPRHRPDIGAVRRALVEDEPELDATAVEGRWRQLTPGQRLAVMDAIADRNPDADGRVVITDDDINRVLAAATEQGS